MSVIRDVIYLSALNNIVNGNKNNNTKPSNNGDGCFMSILKGLWSIFKIIIIFTIIGSVINGIDYWMVKLGFKEEVNVKVADTISIEREYFDTIYNSKGEITNIKLTSKADVQLNFVKDTIFLTTPFECYNPSIGFTFWHPIYNKISKQLSSEHLYVFQLLSSSNNAYKYFLLKKSIPEIEGDMNHMALEESGFCIIYPARSKASTGSIEYFQKDPNIINLELCSSFDIGEHHFSYYKTYLGFTDEQRKILFKHLTIPKRDN